MKKFLTTILFFILAITLNAQEKYAIGMFHFNLQYVAGDYKIETKIIKNSVYPVLQFFEKNPQYKSDIEIQGFAIESLANDHPEVLALLKKLVNKGQIELVIAHYSDQFFIAYPALDLQKSIEISDQILADHGMKRSRVFFGQEIQWTPAYASVLKDKYDLVVTSSDPHGFYRGTTPPLVNVTYGNDHILGLIGAGDTHLPGLDWNFAFLDDGEVFNTLDYNSDFNIVPEQEKKNIDKFKRLQKEGYKFVTMTELASKIKNLKGYKIPDYPFVPEGTWNMSVCGPFMWMGRQRTGVEKDGLTRAASYELRGKIIVAERLIEKSASTGADVTKLKALILEAWKHLLLSEVSDSSGWSPWLVEVQYTDNEVSNAERILDEITKGLRPLFSSDQPIVVLDTKGGKMEPISTSNSNLGSIGVLPIPIAVRAEKSELAVKKFSDNLYRIDVKGLRPADGAVEIIFDTASDGLYYSAGCGEEVAAAIPTDLKSDPAFTLSNGFIYLGNGYSLVKDCSVEHIAATWKVKEQKLVFREELNKNNPEMKMRFYLLKGNVEEGLSLANKLNTWPTYQVRFSKSGFSSTKVMPEDF